MRSGHWSSRWFRCAAPAAAAPAVAARRSTHAGGWSTPSCTWPAPAARGGSCRTTSARETVFHYFQRWTAEGTTDRIHAALRDAVRDADDRDPMASAGVVDSQSVPGAATVGKTSRGYDAGKKVNGRKRHPVVDTGGLLIVVLVTAASVQDRDGGIRVLDRAKMAMPSLVLVWADAAYSRRAQDFAARALHILVQVVAKLVGQSGFVPLPRRWVVERTHAWITGHRRMSRDYERLPAHSEAMIKWAMIGLMARRLAPAPGRRPWQPSTAA
jgi:transposase